MSEIICVTQSKLCVDFINQIEKICSAGIDRIILREKQLDETEYLRLSIEVKKITDKYNIPLTLHCFLNTALNLDSESFHCSYEMLKNVPNKFKLGVSVHSLSEALVCENLGVSYVMAGHIFETDCKAGLKPRGVDFITEICRNVNIPVYAIGGINPENAGLLKNTGIKGICVMSSLMKSENPEDYIKRLRAEL